MALSCHLVLSNPVDCPCPIPFRILSTMCLMATTTLLWLLCLAHADTLASSFHHSYPLDISFDRHGNLRFYSNRLIGSAFRTHLFIDLMIFTLLHHSPPLTQVRNDAADHRSTSRLHSTRYPHLPFHHVPSRTS